MLGCRHIPFHGSLWIALMIGGGPLDRAAQTSAAEGDTHILRAWSGACVMTGEGLAIIQALRPCPDDRVILSGNR